MSALGAVCGIGCGAMIYAAFYLAGFTVLGAGLVLTIVASRISRSRPSSERWREDDRRGAANIIANCGVGALGALAELGNVGLRTEFTALWCVTAIAAGASDTVASEIGKAFGGHPRSFPTWRRVVPGTPGAVSVVGTLAGAGAAALIAAPAAALWLLTWQIVGVVVIACTAGAFTESVLATAFDRGETWTNHALNAINTAVATGVALFLAQYGRP